MTSKQADASRSVLLKLTWAGIGFAILYWFLDALVHLFYFKERGFLAHLFDPTQSELWTRLIVAGVLIAFGMIAHIYFSRSEQALRGSEARARAVYMAIPIPTYTWRLRDGKLILTDYNEAAFSFTKGKITQFMGISVDEMYQERPEIAEEMYRCLGERLSKEDEIDYRMLTTGEQKRLNVKYAYVPPDSVVIHTEDITQRVRAEKEREQLQQKWQSLMENTPNFVIIVDRDGIIQYMNRTKIINSVNEIIGRSVYDFVASEYHERVRRIISRVFDTGESGEYEAFVGPKGHEAWYLTQVGSIKEEDKVVAATLIASDISERKAAEDVLRESQAILQQGIQERTLELATLLEVSNSVASTLELEPSLEKILDGLKSVVEYNGAAISTIDDGILRTISVRAPSEVSEPPEPLQLSRSKLAEEVVRRNESLAIPDAGQDVKGESALVRSLFSEEQVQRIRSLIAVPIVARNRTIGLLSLGHGEAGHYTDKQVQLASAFADLAALALEHDRYHTQTKQFAVMRERERLARDLHDAVTQTLFSVSIVADSLPRLWERDHDEGLNRLEDLRQMTRGALAEMRTLLFELRPGSLADADPRDLLGQLAESMSGRGRVPIDVDVDVEGECSESPEVKVAFYRITQEALNNVVKHAKATRATVSLHFRQKDAELVVEDDGIGFDPSNVPPLKLGIAIMHERAGRIGASLKIESNKDQGTTVTVLWQK
jgi:PAS domain S-box-containing protein